MKKHFDAMFFCDIYSYNVFPTLVNLYLPNIPVLRPIFGLTNMGYFDPGGIRFLAVSAIFTRTGVSAGEHVTAPLVIIPYVFAVKNVPASYPSMSIFIVLLFIFDSLTYSLKLNRFTESAKIID